MPQTVKRNSYQVLFPGGVTKQVIAASVLEVAQEFDDPQLPIQAVKTAIIGVDVIESDIPNPVTFQVLITPAGGAPQTAGCAATPTTFTVEARTPVIFEATVGTGYVFVGWYINGVLQSADLIAAVVIPVPQISGQSVQVEARFAVAP